jgi:hypothetical protein
MGAKGLLVSECGAVEDNFFYALEAKRSTRGLVIDVMI